MYKSQNENYDITDIVVDKAIKIVLIFCRLKGVKCDRISFSFRQFERLFVRRWYELMYREFPYDTNSRLTKSTDLSSAKIRYLCNKN